MIWVSQRVTLIILNVTDADDKSNGEFSCQLNTFNGLWSRKIQVEVVGKPNTPYNCKPLWGCLNSLPCFSIIFNPQEISTWQF